MSVWDVLIGILTIVGGLVSVFASDWVWETQARVDARRGVASERTESWDKWRIVSGIVAIAAGVTILAVPFLTNRPIAPVGEYSCVTGSVFDSTNVAKVLKIQDGGSGDFDGKPFTWQYDAADSIVSFKGEASLRTGDFVLKSRPNDLSLAAINGDGYLCHRR